MNPELSVIIPTVNEAGTLPRSLASLEENKSPFEVIVVDAGSEDGTPEIAGRHGAIALRAAKTSRAAQLNLGAREAKAPLLFFLHADTRPAPGAIDQIVRTLHASPAIAGGAFTRRFDSPSLFLRATTRLADLRSRHFGLFLGDQGIFVRREIFEALGGFDESLELCEDLDFSRRLRALGKTVALRPSVLTSARRFEARGPLRTTLADLRHAWNYFAS